MTDKQQINELDIAIRNIVKNNFVKVPNYGKYGGYLCDIDISTSSIATALYNAGYRKIDENAVVLTREEYYEMLADVKTVKEKLVRMFDRTKAETRKETAKEIYITGKYYYAKHSPMERQLSDFLAHIKETYGVEVEE